jgi:hypothetical protein
MKTFRTIFKTPPHSSSPKMLQSVADPQTELISRPYNSHHLDNTDSSTSPLTVIELFQSQGCNSCPPANDFCITHFPPNDPKHLLLTYEVTYWDHLGWPDTFGDKRWDARQRDYAAVLRQRSVYTPQVIVDGGARPLGGNGWRDLSAILAVPKKSAKVELKIATGQDRRVVRASNGDGKRGDVLVVFYETQPEDVKILKGENRGETLPHRNVVRDIQVVGEWKGQDDDFELPAEKNGLNAVVLIQAGRGGEILGAIRV